DAAQREMPFALLGYPLLQAADILAVRATAVPVGGDNAAHVEIARELARRFNRRYGQVFPVPALIPADVPVLPGTDGRGKMSKSVGNAIYLSDSPGEVAAKVRRMYTDPARTSPGVPGMVEGNPVFVFHKIFNDHPEEVADLEERYRAGKVGDAEVKEKLTAALNRFLDPIRERRAGLAEDQGLVEELIVTGTERTRIEVKRTAAETRAAMGLTTALAGFRRAARSRGARWARTWPVRPGLVPARHNGPLPFRANVSGKDHRHAGHRGCGPVCPGRGRRAQPLGRAPGQQGSQRGDVLDSGGRPGRPGAAPRGRDLRRAGGV